jgi:hypothetical protein
MSGTEWIHATIAEELRLVAVLSYDGDTSFAETRYRVGKASDCQKSTEKGSRPSSRLTYAADPCSVLTIFLLEMSSALP